jgi:hypothetical protein
MKYFRVAVLAAALLAVRSARAEETLAALKQQLQSLQQQVQRLQDQVAALESAKTPPQAAETAVAPSAPWSPTSPIRLASAGPAYLNLSLVANAVIGTSTEPDVESLEGAHHDPNQRGFSLTGVELVLDGAVDPYFKGLAAMAFVLEPGGETAFELEEAWLQTTSLPWNLQARGGLCYAEFGRQNPQHPHSWAFVDQAVILRRLFGPDGLRNPGARLSWLAPTPWYTELTLAVFNSDGGTAFSFRGGEGHEHGHDEEDHGNEIHGGEPVESSLRNLGDLLYVPRLATSFNFTDRQTLVLGASAAFGPNDSGENCDTQIYGVDAYWKWQPEQAQRGFPFVALQAEALCRRYEAGEREHPADPPVTLPAETLHDWGVYAQALWGFHPGWIAGLRGEYATGNEAAYDSDLRTERIRVSPNLTFLPSEFSKIRLQYNYDHREDLGSDHTVWLQVEFALGAHAAHKF